MIKRFSLAAAALLLAGGASTASAQLKLGVAAGVNLSKLSYGKSGLSDSGLRAGWYAGPKAWLSFPLSGFGVNASALYCRRRLNMRDGTGGDGVVSGSKNLSTIEIPVNVRYTVGVGAIASLFAETGPQFGFNIGRRAVSEAVRYKSACVSWNAGAGLRLLGHIEVGVGYNFALSNCGRLYIADLNGSENSFKPNTWQVQLAYLF